MNKRIASINSKKLSFRSIRGIAFDFDGVFTDNKVITDQNGIESVTCWRSDGLGLKKLRNKGFKVVIISSETNPVVAMRAKKLDTEYIQGVDNKSIELIKWAKSNELSLNEIAFVGNDINDIPAFEIVGLSIGVLDSHPDIYSYLDCMTTSKGGYGAVREVCDQLTKKVTKNES